MLKKIKFSNYKCFKNSEMTFRDITIIVGQNNAGKSSIIEALRLIALAGRKSRTITKYNTPPEDLGLPISQVGIFLNVEKLKINIRTAVYFYKDDLATIAAVYNNNTKIIIYIKNEIVFACLFDEKGNVIKTKGTASYYSFDSIGILPQIGLIKENEKLLNKDTVHEDKDTYLSSRHFRNEILFNKDDYFLKFKELAEETWHGLRIDDLCYKPTENEFIFLYLKDAGFPAEIGLMGSGIQMWLQIIWFICRTEKVSTIILDEPDVYMHPDLQRKILSILKSKYSQIIIATHSVEIISDVEPGNIIAVDKASRQMKYASDSKAVQKIIDDIGGVQNISLLRIANSRKCVFVEGDDLKILSKFCSIVHPNDYNSLKSLPCVSLNGFSRLYEAFGAAKLFQNETSGSIKVFCLLDHDYYPNEYLHELMENANANGLILHIWRRKEIENYILVPRAIFRLTQRPETEYDQFISKYSDLIDSFKDHVLDRITGKFFDYHKKNGIDYTSCPQMARNYLFPRWTTLDSKISLIGGKMLISKTNEWIRSNYNKSCSQDNIIKCIQQDEVDSEIVEVIDQLIR